MKRFNNLTLSGVFCLVLSAVLMPLLGGAAQSAETQEKSSSTSAGQLLIRATQARAVWNDFPGFSADVIISNGRTSLKGRLTVTDDGSVNLDVAKPSEVEWAQRRLESVVQHRQPSGQRDRRASFADKINDHPFGRLIKFDEDRFHSQFRIQGDVIREVHRTMGTTRFIISVTEISRNAEGKTLPRSYSVSFWNSENGKLKKTIVSHNQWVRVGKFDLPAKLVGVTNENEGKRSVRQIKLSNHRLLNAKAAK